jgi:hypothetical protein
VKLLSFYRRAQQPKPKPEPKQATDPSIPPCPVCGAEAPYLLESFRPCCRRYLRAYDACD